MVCSESKGIQGVRLTCWSDAEVGLDGAPFPHCRFLPRANQVLALPKSPEKAAERFAVVKLAVLLPSVPKGKVPASVLGSLGVGAPAGDAEGRVAAQAVGMWTGLVSA